jgi:hypothetical protein
MREAFTSRGDNCIIPPVNVECQFILCQDPPQFGFSLQVLSPLQVTVTPQILEKVESLSHQCQNYMILKDLKQYRPHRRPMTEVPEEVACHPVVRRKRRLIVRDWFYYVVWFVRLRRIVRGLYLEEEASMRDLERDQRYKDIIMLLQGHACKYLEG